MAAQLALRTDENHEGLLVRNARTGSLCMKRKEDISRSGVTPNADFHLSDQNDVE